MSKPSTRKLVPNDIYVTRCGAYVRVRKVVNKLNGCEFVGKFVHDEDAERLNKWMREYGKPGEYTNHGKDIFVILYDEYGVPTPIYGNNIQAAMLIPWEDYIQYDEAIKLVEDFK